MKRWWLSGVVMLVALVEVLLREDLPSRAAALAFTGFIALALGFRRTRPLAATAGAFTLATASTLAQHYFDLPELAPAASAFVLVLPYALTRWGSRRDVAIGAGFVVMTWVTAVTMGKTTRREDVIGSAVVLTLPGTIGVIVRLRDEAARRALGEARSNERAQLARELHDSVAHHVTAITLQAQAARAVLATRPDDASRALRAIEDEAKATLVELRSIVGSLRDDEVALAPAAGLADVQRLADAQTVVEVTGVDVLSPVLERALFRLAQEAVTNARKHAKHASSVHVRIEGAATTVTLTASDDGEPTTRRGAGFGLVGMAERVALLGGTFEAGPLPERGWRVHAVIPR